MTMRRHRTPSSNCGHDSFPRREACPIASVRRVIDLHCHVIPGIDDGPSTMEDALALCVAAGAAGTETIIATPHLNSHYPAIDAVAIHTGLGRLNGALKEAAIDVRLRAGAEMALSRLPDLTDAEIGVL